MRTSTVLLPALVFALILPPPQALAQQPSSVTPHTITQLNGRRIVARRVLLKFKTPPSSRLLSALAAQAAATYLQPLGGSGWYRLDSSKFTASQIIASLSQVPNVAKAEPDYVGQPMATSIGGAGRLMRPMFDLPNDPFYSLQWAYENTGQTVAGIAGTPGADINAPAAWTLAKGSKGVVLVDFDTGIDYNNPDLAANVWSAPSAYTITIGGNVYNCPQGSHGFNAIDGQSGCAGQEFDNDTFHPGHGTFMAGIMGAVGNNGVGVTGVNWSASIISISICTANECDTSTAITGIEAALQIADQFGLRLVAGNLSHGDLGESAMQDEMTRAGTLNGLLFAASTGDECSSSPDDPASFHLANELAVASSDQNDQVAHWSGGNCSNGGGDLAAPGTNIYTTIRGDNGNNPLPESGTSVSTPLVTGALGLLASACPLDPAALIATLKGTSDLKPALDSIATDGRRLNLGNAIASCAAAGHTSGTGTIQITLEDSGDGLSDTGTISVTADGVFMGSYSYDTSVDTVDSIGQGLAASISNSLITAAYTGPGTISIATTAKGPYTGYSMTASVQNGCVGGEACGPAPFAFSSGIAAGN